MSSMKACPVLSLGLPSRFNPTAEMKVHVPMRRAVLIPWNPQLVKPRLVNHEERGLRHRFQPRVAKSVEVESTNLETNI